MESINDILNGEQADALVVDEPEAETPAVEAVTDDRPRDEHGRFLPKETGVEQLEEPVAVPPTPEASGLPPEVYAPLKAVRDENKELKARLAALEAKPPAPPPPIPSVFEDEEGFTQGFGSQVVQQAVTTATQNARLDMSEMLARQAHEADFDEMKATFLELATAHPELAEQARNDPHPWAKAYTIAKNHVAMKELGATDVDSLKAKLREEIMAEMAATPRAQSLPPTISNEQNVGSRTGPAWAGPKSLSEMLS